MTRAIDALNELTHAPGFARHLEILFRYIMEVYDIPRQELLGIATQTIKSDVEEAIMTTYEQLIEEGKQIGLLEGKKIGRQE